MISEEKVKKRRIRHDPPEVIKARSRKYYEENSEKINKNTSAWYHANKNKPGFKDRIKDNKLKRFYGISLAQYKEILKKQLDVCAICFRPQQPATRPLDVDHNHQTGKVRGLLCVSCNMGLGAFCDSKELLARAGQYLTTDIQEQNGS